MAKPDIDPTDYFDFFPGCVPPGEVFRSNADDLIALAKGASKDLAEGKIIDLCLIGLYAYFETFCRDQFATLINIHPGLIMNLKKSGQDVTVDASKFLTCRVNPLRSIGFLLAEQFDFGTAKKINTLYQALLNITPFSHDEVGRYSDMIADRNLIVHHGGTFTSKYLEQRGITGVPERHRVYVDSLRISPTQFISNVEYLKSIARKLVRGSHDALVRLLEGDGHTIIGDTKSALFMTDGGERTEPDSGSSRLSER